MLMQGMGVKIIYSRPYHPQTQGKVCCKINNNVILTTLYQIERFNRTWKSFLMW